MATTNKFWGDDGFTIDDVGNIINMAGQIVGAVTGNGNVHSYDPDFDPRTFSNPYEKGGKTPNIPNSNTTKDNTMLYMLLGFGALFLISNK